MPTRSLPLVFLVAIIGPACKRPAARDASAPSSAPPPPTQAGAPAPASPNPDSLVQYAAPTMAFGALAITSGDYYDSIGPGYKIGTLLASPYRGADFVSARRRTDEPCKGEGCDEPLYLRFLRLGAKVVYLRRNSDAGSYFEQQKAEWQRWTDAFAATGLSLVADSTFAVRLFFPRDTIAYTSSTFRFVSRTCGGASQQVAFRHAVFQDVRFDGKLFYVTRPDGSCLAFEYVPYFSEREIVWDSPPTESNHSGYSWKQNDEFGTLELRYAPFVSADVVQIDRDAKAVGHTQRGEPVYELKDHGHPLLKEFFRDYEADFAHAEARAAQFGGKWQDSTGVQPPKLSYEQFLAARPIFFWRDPFGRLMRFTNNDFLPVSMAEPVIYLYPTAAQRVHVEAQPLYDIRAAIPRYHAGWDVLAQPTGELTDATDGKRHSYLFWEGLSFISPMRQEGFVIAQDEVAGFLKRTLPMLGLDERESDDFREAWLPRFHGAPYYFVTFLPRETIDQLAPLVVTPKPDVVIRVLMDFKPLWTREHVTAPGLPRPPGRRGFTVVEWGGILR